jgi:hypothetical protein
MGNENAFLSNGRCPAFLALFKGEKSRRWFVKLIDKVISMTPLQKERWQLGDIDIDELRRHTSRVFDRHFCVIERE